MAAQKEPEVRCIYCYGTGIYPYSNKITCPVCNGVGIITDKGTPDECLKCTGTGMEGDSDLPCIDCEGKGFV